MTGPGMASSEKKLLSGKRGLVMGVANDHSIAWGIAQACAGAGAELAFTYQGDAFGKRVKPLAASLGAKLCLPADVEDEQSMEALFGAIQREWGRLDFVVHCIAYADKAELKGRYCDTSRKNFARALDISCFSFTDLARRAAPLMSDGGSLVTLSYMGAIRVIPNYNVMGVAKAALEASVRYLAADLGPAGIRVNCISAGPMRTLAGSAIGDARLMFKWNRMNAPMKKNIELEHVGNAGLYLVSDLSGGVTGEIHYVDSGYNIVGMPSTADLKLMGLPDEGGETKPARAAE